MLSIELLRMIQADREREIAAADRVRWLRPADSGTEVDGRPIDRLATRGAKPPRRPQTGTASAATDPCL
jgi:hypothetical protein